MLYDYFNFKPLQLIFAQYRNTTGIGIPSNTPVFATLEIGVGTP
jgi:hypothetical protein